MPPKAKKKKTKAVKVKTRVKKKKAKSKPLRASAKEKIVAAPVAVSKQVFSGNPRLDKLQNGDTRVVHKEFITEITAGSLALDGPMTVYDFTTVDINPGLAVVFPWMANIANRYESYRCNSIRFYYETELPTTVGGSILMAVDYDSRDDAPIDKQTFMTLRGAVRSPPWARCEFVANSEDIHKRKSYFVRTGAQPTDTDIRLYDTGKFYIASQNLPTAGMLLGEVYVEYDITFMTPTTLPAPDMGPSIKFVAEGKAITFVAPFGPAPIIDDSDVPNSGVKILDSGHFKIEEPGNYLFQSYVESKVVAPTGDNVIPINGGADSFVDDFFDGVNELVSTWKLIAPIAGTIWQYVVGGGSGTSAINAATYILSRIADAEVFELGITHHAQDSKRKRFRKVDLDKVMEISKNKRSKRSELNRLKADKMIAGLAGYVKQEEKLDDSPLVIPVPLTRKKSNK